MTPSPTPFFDPQVNGYAGIDFQQDHLGAHELLAAAQCWRNDGGKGFFLTLITDDWSRLLHRLSHLHQLVSSHPELRQTILGWHLEGPFLSEQPGFHGAHDPKFMRDPVPEDFLRLRRVVGDDRLLVTLAPERPGSLDCIAQARALDIHVSLGHTNASASVLEAAVSAGARGFTHLANGCPQQLDRHDNILWRVLDVASRQPSLIIGLIADAIHVSPPLFRLFHRLLPPDRLYYTTDAMAAAGSTPGRYRIGALEVEVGADGVVRQPGRTNFAGSSLRPNQVQERASALLQDPQVIQDIPRILTSAESWLLAPTKPG